jgi:hypothetical protein
MGLDIGQALREGASRTAGRNGLILAAVFAGIALLTTVLIQTFSAAAVDTLLSTFQNASPGELGMSQAEYDRALSDFETAAQNARGAAPLALGLSAGAAAAGLLSLAVVGEAVSIVAVRVFATDDPAAVSSDLVTSNIVVATLNGFVGGIVVWGLIIIGLIFLLIPGIVLAVLFYFLRQEIALNDKNFVQAMADSWRITKSHRIEVFVIGAALLVVSQLEQVSAAVVGIVSTTGGVVAAAATGGLLSAFGAAVVTRAYVQIDDGGTDPDETEREEDPYDAALGPDDLTR